MSKEEDIASLNSIKLQDFIIEVPCVFCELEAEVLNTARCEFYQSSVAEYSGSLDQCFSIARPRPNTGPWHQLYRAARDSPGTDN